jgi:hypothetical protein
MSYDSCSSDWSFEVVMSYVCLMLVAGERRQANCSCIADKSLAHQSCAVSGMASTLHQAGCSSMG